MFIRITIAAVIALICGAVFGFGLGALFISTPLQQVLGPRYSEFDFMGVIGVALISAIIGCIGAMVTAASSQEKIRSTFQPRNLISLILVPQIVLLILTFTLSGEWAWAVQMHLAACLAILAGTAAVMKRG